MSSASAPDSVRSKLKALVAQRFDLNDQDSDFCADWIESQLDFGSRFIDRPKDVSALERLDRALLDLGVALKASEMSEGTLERLKRVILTGPIRGTGDEATIAYMANTGTPDLLALERTVDRFGAIREAVALTINEIERDPHSKRHLSQTDGKAMGAVQGCRHVWKVCTGKAPPVKDLNEASPFAKFLTDVMRECGIDDPKPVSAFRAWVRESQKSNGQAENSG